MCNAVRCAAIVGGRSGRVDGQWFLEGKVAIGFAGVQMVWWRRKREVGDGTHCMVWHGEMVVWHY